ncbi:hypothetical protein [Mesobacillus zeae]|uniref:hypothetical protein n=1 Tax=Mesobacillus zeae TaxID=1917180 RepID=UPI00300B5E8A
MEQLSIFNFLDGHNFVEIPVNHPMILGLTRLKGDSEVFYLDPNYLVRFFKRKVFSSDKDKNGSLSFSAEVYTLKNHNHINNYTSELEHIDVIWSLKHEAECYQQLYHLDTLPYPLNNPDCYFQWREELISRETERESRLRDWKRLNHIAS